MTSHTHEADAKSAADDMETDRKNYAPEVVQYARVWDMLVAEKLVVIGEATVSAAPGVAATAATAPLTVSQKLENLSRLADPEAASVIKVADMPQLVERLRIEKAKIPLTRLHYQEILSSYIKRNSCEHLSKGLTVIAGGPAGSVVVSSKICYRCDLSLEGGHCKCPSAVPT